MPGTQDCCKTSLHQEAWAQCDSFVQEQWGYVVLQLPNGGGGRHHVELP